MKRGEVRVLWKQIFGRRITRVRKERTVIFLASDVDQGFHKLGDLPGTQPSNHGRGNFISDEIAKNGAMAGILAHALGDGTFGISADLTVVKKFQMFAPRNRDQRPEVELFAKVQKPSWRHVIYANQVDPSLSHKPEVAPGLLGRSEVHTCSVGCKWTVGHSFHKELFIALEEELRASAHPMVHGDTAREVDMTCPAGKIRAQCTARLCWREQIL